VLLQGVALRTARLAIAQRGQRQAAIAPRTVHIALDQKVVHVGWIEQDDVPGQPRLELRQPSLFVRDDVLHRVAQVRPRAVRLKQHAAGFVR